MKLSINFNSILLTFLLSAMIFLSNTTTQVGSSALCDVVEENPINTIDLKVAENESLKTFSKNNTILYLNEDDIYLMSQIVCAESKGEPFEGKVAVATVILNRAMSPQFPSTIEDVVFQENAFSCVVDGCVDVIPNQECFDAVYEALNNDCSTVEALFFYNPEIATCNWMTNVEKADITPIGNHVFFNLD